MCIYIYREIERDIDINCVCQAIVTALSTLAPSLPDVTLS